MYPGGLIQCVIEFKKRFKDKTGLPWESRMEDPKSGKYTLLDIHYDDSESQEVSPYTNHQENRACSPVKSGKISPATADLLELIFNEQYFEKSLDRLGYDHEKLPLGQLGQTTIKKAYDTLNRLADAINEPIDQENEEVHLFINLALEYLPDIK
jgi:poly [ADP-ribose] polymerase